MCYAQFQAGHDHKTGESFKMWCKRYTPTVGSFKMIANHGVDELGAILGKKRSTVEPMFEGHPGDRQKIPRISMYPTY